jgi:serine/threonine-protein kinase
MAGNLASAIPLLRRGASGCYLLNASILMFAARVWLANALAEMGSHDEARALYRSVLDRWGHAKPRSGTAEAARAGLKALGE